MTMKTLEELAAKANEEYIEPTLKDVWPSLLTELRKTVSTKNWDGYGAYAVSDQVFQNADIFVDLLIKENVELLDIIPNSAGTLGFAFMNDSYVEIGKIRYGGYIQYDEHRLILDGKMDTFDNLIKKLKELSNE